MPPRKLLHYLRSYRKVVGLSQGELAHLLGCRYGAKVSRYEVFSRMPSMRTAVAYEIIFRAPLKSLFPDLYLQVHKRIGFNARALLVEVERRGTRRNHALAFLRGVVSDAANIKKP
jgi:DNA-binding XRE family transcriptional regulator